MEHYTVVLSVFYMITFSVVMGYYAKVQHGWNFWKGFSIMMGIHVGWFILTGGQVLD